MILFMGESDLIAGDVTQDQRAARGFQGVDHEDVK